MTEEYKTDLLNRLCKAKEGVIASSQASRSLLDVGAVDLPIADLGVCYANAAMLVVLAEAVQMLLLNEPAQDDGK